MTTERMNVLLGGLDCLLAAGLARELVTPRPLPPVRAPERANHVVTATVARSAAPLPTTDYGVIVAKNLFSPDRSEATTIVRAAAGPRPLLYGVVVDGPRSRAYLEDPAVKGVFGYRTGDELGGGRITTIRPDRVVISRPDGALELDRCLVTC